MQLYLGLAVTLAAIVGLSIWSGTQVKSGSQRQNGLPVVAGVIMGTLVGGSSSIVTAQLGYTYGMSGWWFTPALWLLHCVCGAISALIMPG